MKNKIKKINPDILVVCQGNIELCIKGLLAGYLSKIKTISYIPSAQYFKYINSIFYQFRDVLGDMFFNIADIYITPNKYQKKLIQNRSINKETFIICNPLQCNIYDEIIFSNKEIINIGIIGRINLKIKNQLISIEVAKKLIDKKKNFKFHIIGDGKDLEKFKSLISINNLSENFIFYGWLEDEEKNKIIQNHIDIIMVPSLIETGLPLVVYDAFENNKKFLMSDIDSIKEYYLPEQFLININDIDSLVEKIICLNELTDNYEYIKFRKKIFNEYSLDKFKIQVKETFEKILCGH